MNHFSSNVNKFPISFWFFIETLTLLLHVRRCAGNNTEPPSDSNISKTVRLNIAFPATSFKEYSTSFVIVCRLTEFALAALKLLIYEVRVTIGISKIELFNFSGTERVKQNQKNIKPIQNLLSLYVNHF